MPQLQEIFSSGNGRGWRPFSCPNCRQIISSRTRYLRYGAITFWMVFLAIVALLSKVVGIIGGLLLGLAAGGTSAFFVLQALNRFFPREAVLILHQNHLPPDELRNLAAIADELSRLSEWTDRAETEIDALERNKTYDEEFEDVIIEAGCRLKEALGGAPAATRNKQSQLSAPRMNVEEWKFECEAIARDIRLAVGQFESKGDASELETSAKT